jgi:hypothetical protein
LSPVLAGDAVRPPLTVYVTPPGGYTMRLWRVLATVYVAVAVAALAASQGGSSLWACVVPQGPCLMPCRHLNDRCTASEDPREGDGAVGVEDKGE